MGRWKYPSAGEGMIGGVVTSAVLELLLYPVIYVLWKRRALPTRPLPDLSL